MTIKEVAQKARQASFLLPEFTAEQRRKALQCIKDQLTLEKEKIFLANQLDIEEAEKDHLAAPLLGRLAFNEKKLKSVQAGIDSLIGLDDPVGKTSLARELSEGLNLYRIICPIGVIGVIFESRPDALVQIASLCVKSGNAVLLKGGHEAHRTNRALFDCICKAAQEAGLPEGWAGLLESREDVDEMLKQDHDIDLIIPRGSNSFVRYIMDHTHIAVMGHADGICHVYADRTADVETAVRVMTDSKTQNFSVCNAAETFLVHRDIAAALLSPLKASLDAKQVQIRGDEEVRRIIDVRPADEIDWRTQYLDRVVSIRIVDSVNEAIDHINSYGSHHTDSILTQDDAAARLFCRRVDSADVFVNCSTRFSDGFVFGFGAEVGIATGKLHARGPVGMEGLCTYKYQLVGHGHILNDFASGEKHYTHQLINEDAPF